jgi:hypothetical protein
MIDIVNRLRFDAIRCEAQFSKGVARNITEAADEIERLRKQLDNRSKLNHARAKLIEGLRVHGQIMLR